MKANIAPEKIYIPRLINDGKLIHEWVMCHLRNFVFFFDKEIAENIEYTRTDAFIEKACEFLKSYRQDTPDGTGYIAGIVNDKTIEDFRKYMKE